MHDDDLKSVVALAPFANIRIMESGNGPLIRYHNDPISLRERKRVARAGAELHIKSRTWRVESE